MFFLGTSFFTQQQEKNSSSWSCWMFVLCQERSFFCCLLFFFYTFCCCAKNLRDFVFFRKIKRKRLKIFVSFFLGSEGKNCLASTPGYQLKSFELMILVLFRENLRETKSVREKSDFPMVENWYQNWFRERKLTNYIR